MKRLLPSPLLSAGLLVLWILLMQSLSVGTLLLGTALALLFTTVTIMGQSIVAEKLKAGGGPDLVIRPNVGAFRLLDFFSASAILRAAEPVKAEVKEGLARLLAVAP